jgi:hypothetical protein
MTQKKTRIKIEKKGNGNVAYYPQIKNLLGWQGFFEYEHCYAGTTKLKVSCSSQQDAQTVIDKYLTDMKASQQVQITYVAYP